MKSTPSLRTSIGYPLVLSDGCTWCLSGVDDCTKLVRRLAAIMRLKETGTKVSPTIFFCKSSFRDDMVDLVTSTSNFPGSYTHWNLYDHNILRIWCHDTTSDVICEVKDIEDAEMEVINMWFSLHPIYLQSIERGGLPFHAGLAELDGQGIVLAAPGDQGKSTCCRRLPDSWRPLCDDETLVVLAQQQEYRAHPFPTWSDYLLKRCEGTWKVQYSVPLSGIFFIEQAGTDEVEPVGKGEAALLMTESATQVCQKFWRKVAKKDKKKFRKELFNNACEMAGQIPAYRLRASLQGRFWEKIEEVLG